MSLHIQFVDLDGELLGPIEAVYLVNYTYNKIQTCDYQTLLAGFEPARGDPNGFLVHRLNLSATTTTERPVSS